MLPTSELQLLQRPRDALYRPPRTLEELQSRQRQRRKQDDPPVTAPSDQLPQEVPLIISKEATNKSRDLHERIPALLRERLHHARIYLLGKEKTGSGGKRGEDMEHVFQLACKLYKEASEKDIGGGRLLHAGLDMSADSSKPGPEAGTEGRMFSFFTNVEKQNQHNPC